jgi:energy-coupling factor transporter ATP-binding protein EcfA2
MSKDQFRALIAQSGNIVISEERFATFLDLCFNVYCFYLDVGGFSTIKPIMIPLACTRFLKKYIDTKSVLTFVRLIFEEIGIRYDLDFDDEVVHFDADNLEAQGFLASARKSLNTWDSISHAELAIKFQTVIKCLLSCTLTQQLSLDFIPERILEYANVAKLGISACTTTPLKMIQSLLDFMLTFVESGYEFFVTGDLQSFLVADRAVRDFIRDWEKLEIELTGSVVNLQARPSLYLDRLDNIIARGNALLSVSNYIIRPLIKSAMDHRMRFLKQVNISCFRKPPFSLLLHGPPGIGKSSLINILGTLYHRVVTTMSLDNTVDKTPIYPDLTWDPMFNTHTKNPYDDFWSGYRGASQWLVILDDLAREKARQVEAGLGLTIIELLSIVNSIGITSNQAALEDKGAVPIIPKLVIATSNTKGLHAQHAGSCPEAILRRLPYVIRPWVKPEYWDSKLGKMKEMHHVLDAWTFRIEMYYMFVDSQGLTRGDYLLYKPDPLRESDDCTMAELQAFLCEKILSHERSTQSMMDGLKIDSNIKICEHGVLSSFSCSACYFAQKKARNRDDPDYVDDAADFKERQEENADTSDYVEESDLESQGFKEIACGLGGIAVRPVKRVLNELVYRPTAAILRKLHIELDPALYFSILPNCPDIGHTMSPETINYIMSIGELLPTRVFDEILLYLMKSGRNRQLVYFAMQKYYSVRIPKKVAILLDLVATFALSYGATRIVTILMERLLSATGFRKEQQAEAQANIWKSSENNDSFMIPNTTSKNNDSEIENTVMRSTYELAVREHGATDSQ